MIKDPHFIGCGCNGASQVEQFIVEDTIFEGVEGRGTTLVLKEVIDASIKATTSPTSVSGPPPACFWQFSDYQHPQ